MFLQNTGTDLSDYNAIKQKPTTDNNLPFKTTAPLLH